MTDATEAPAERPKSSRGITIFLVLLVLGMLAVGLGPALYHDIRAANIRGKGTKVEGTIVTLMDTGDRFNDNPVVRVTVAITPPQGGEVVHGQVVDAISPVHLPRYQPGSKIQVFIDPENPSRIALEQGL